MKPFNILLLVTPLADGVQTQGRPSILFYIGVVMFVYGALVIYRLIRIYHYVNIWIKYNLEAIENPWMPRISAESIPSPFAAFDPRKTAVEDMVRDRKGFEQLRLWAGL